MHKVVINDCYGGFALSREAEDWLYDNYGLKADAYLDLTRHDPRLVKCVETLGEKANSTFSRLKIVEIEGRIYIIENYDGKETIIQPDDIDWIIINSHE